MNKKRRKNKARQAHVRKLNSQPAKPAAQQPGQPATPPQVAQQPQASQEPPTKRWWLPKTPREGVAWIIAAVSLMVALGGFYFNRRNSDISQRNDDRASGKIKAKFQFVRIGNTDETTLAPFTKKNSFGNERVYLDDVETLMRWGPYVEVKNTGDEVIDAIRVEVEFAQGVVMGAGVKQKTPTPIVAIQPSIVLPSMGAKLMPGQSARVLLTKPLLEQIVGAKMEYPGTNECEAWFLIRVSCRVFGSTAYDPPDPPKINALLIAWLRNGFAGEQVKKVLELQPRAMIEGN